MIKFYILFLSLVFTSAVSAGEQSEKLCNCLKEAVKTNNPSKKKSCLTLQEKLVKQMGKGSEAYKEFKTEMSECDRNIALSSVKPEKEPETVTDAINEICECSKLSAKDRGKRMKCMMLQDQYSKKFAEEKRVEFLKESNKCF